MVEQASFLTRRPSLKMPVFRVLSVLAMSAAIILFTTNKMGALVPTTPPVVQGPPTSLKASGTMATRSSTQRRLLQADAAGPPDIQAPGDVPATASTNRDVAASVVAAVAPPPTIPTATSMVKLTVPSNAKVGDAIQFQMSDGRAAEIKVPLGAVPGKQIHVQVPRGGESSTTLASSEVAATSSTTSTTVSSTAAEGAEATPLRKGNPTPSPTCHRGECFPQNKVAAAGAGDGKGRGENEEGREVASKAVKKQQKKNQLDEAKANEREHREGAEASVAAAAVAAAMADKRAASSTQSSSSSSASPLSPSSSSSLVSSSPSTFVASCFEPQCEHPWRDSVGERIEAHGGGMLRDEERGLWFWYGEGAKVGEGGRSLSVRAYVSAELGGPWHALGHALTAAEVLAGLDRQQVAQAARAKKAQRHPENPTWRTWAADILDFPRFSLKLEQLILERPKVIYNPSTKKYVMWLHLDATHSKKSPQNKNKHANKKQQQVQALAKSQIAVGSSSNSSSPSLAEPSGVGGQRRSLLSETSEDKGEGEGDLKDVDSNNIHVEEEDAEGVFSGGIDNDDISETTTSSSGFEEGGGIGMLQKYWVRRAGVAVSDFAEGPFTFEHALRPDGRASLDIQLFQEEDVDEDEDEDDVEDDEDIHGDIEKEEESSTRSLPSSASQQLSSRIGNAANQSSSMTTATTPTEPLRRRRHLQSMSLQTKTKTKNKSKKQHTTAPAAYLIRSVDNLFVGISRLSDDYLNTTSQGIVSTYRPALEGMAVFRLPNGTYYAVLSHMTGWEPNPMVLLRAEGRSLEDPRWVFMGNPTHEPRSPLYSSTPPLVHDGHHSFNSQPAFVVKIRPDRKAKKRSNSKKKEKPYFVLMGDNWVRAGPLGLADAGYVWLPLQFHTDTVRLQRLANWSTSAPFKTSRWENASELHALATSDHATTLPWAKNKNSLRGGSGNNGESWSALEDPHASWCQQGFVYRGDSPYCCSQVCGMGCGEPPSTAGSGDATTAAAADVGLGAASSSAEAATTSAAVELGRASGNRFSGCEWAKEMAVNGTTRQAASTSSSAPSSSSAPLSAAQLALRTALDAARTSKEGGEEAWRLLASNVKCCPQDIGNRPCENAQDTACLLERAPTSSSLFRSGGSGKGVGRSGGKGGVQSPLDLEWSPKQFDKLSEKAQKKAEKAALLKKIDASFFKSSSSASKSSSSGSSAKQKKTTSTATSPASSSTSSSSSSSSSPALKSLVPLGDESGGVSLAAATAAAAADDGIIAVTAVAVPASAPKGTLVVVATAATTTTTSGGSSGSGTSPTLLPLLFNDRPPSATPLTAKEKRREKEREKEKLLASLDNALFKDRPTLPSYAASTAFKNLQAPNIGASGNGAATTTATSSSSTGSRASSSSSSNSAGRMSSLAKRHGDAVLSAAAPKPPPHPIWSAKILDKASSGGGSGSSGGGSTSGVGGGGGAPFSVAQRKASKTSSGVVDLGVGGLTPAQREARPVAPDFGKAITSSASGGGATPSEKTQPWQWNKPWLKKKPAAAAGG